MAKMMGFSGFSSGAKPPPPSGSKKRKLNTSSPPEDRAGPPQGIPLGNSKGPNPNLIAVPAARAARARPSTPPAATERQPQQQQQHRRRDDGERAAEDGARPSSAGFGGGGRDDDVLAKPLDGLTGRDLARLRAGVKMADGRTVFFLPSFLEDPWA